MKNQLVSLAEIGLKAVEVYSAEQAVKKARADLKEAYKKFKEGTGIHFVEKDSQQWEYMMQVTSKENEVLQDAIRVRENARNRMYRAIARGNREA